MNMAGTDFGKLLESYAAAVRRFVLFLGADAASADDIVAETFARAWTVSAPLRQDTVKAYLFTIARNLYRQSVRRARRHGELPVDLADEAVSAERLVNDRSELA